jgi:ribosome assembly protein 1
MASSVFLPPEQTRLVTICAHVDHGKTTLADNLIERNGIISERLAGTLRYLDSLEEEQRRGITMRASAIGLRHAYKSKQAATDIVVHLLDSPGHTDFSTEVSSSLQCCDGCLLVVDAVEGMCARTHQVVREAHHHQLVPILVINKLDRLCTSLCLTPTEAYLRLRSLVESVNATCAAMLASKHAETEDGSHNETEEMRWNFEPGKGNVIFASALYGWGFTVPSLGRSLFRQKVLPIKPVVLKQYLFGDFKYKQDGGKVLKWKPDSGDEPLFAEFGLQPLWDIYGGVASAAAACGAGSALFADGRIVSKAKNSLLAKIQVSTPGMDQVLASMQTGATGNQPPPSTTDELQRILTHTGASTEEPVLRCLLRRYRPLSDIVLDTVYEVCPSPLQAASEVRPRALAFSPPHPESFLPIQRAARHCDASLEAPTVAHICKFMSTDRANIRDPHLGDAQTGVILGLARVLSGRLKTGDDYYVMGPKHNADQTAPRRMVRLYLLMGSTFVLVDEVPAGHLCAIQNLEDVQLKTATLCDRPEGRPLQGFDQGIRPLVKVNVESVNPADTPILERGLIKLSLADAAVEVTATAKGERLLACLGELHLEQSIIDLKKVYCGHEDIELRISDPIVEFGETTDWFENELLDFGTFFDNEGVGPLRQCTIPPYNEEEGLEFAHRGRVRAILSGRLAAISLRAVPLKRTVHSALKEQTVVEGSEDDLVRLGKGLGLDGGAESVLKTLLGALCSIDESGNALVESQTLCNGLSARGVVSENEEVHVPRKAVEETKRSDHDEDDEQDDRGDAPKPDCGLDAYLKVRERIRKTGFLSKTSESETCCPADTEALSIWKNHMQGSVVAGFQMALRAGPICEEPVRGVLVVLEGMEVAVQPTSASSSSSDNEEFKCAKPLSGGMVVAALRSGIRCALLYVATLCPSLYRAYSIYGNFSNIFFTDDYLSRQVKTFSIDGKPFAVDASLFVGRIGIALCGSFETTRQGLGGLNGGWNGPPNDFCYNSSRRILWSRSGIISTVEWRSHSSRVDLFSLGTIRSGSVLDSNVLGRTRRFWRNSAEWRCVHWNGQHGPEVYSKGPRTERALGRFH